MKTLFSILKIITALLIAGTLFFSCSLKIVSPEEYGTLVVNLPGSGSAARAAEWFMEFNADDYPYFEDYVSKLRFRIDSNAPGVTSRSSGFGGSVSISLPAGTWIITVSALNAAGEAIGVTEKMVTIEGGKSISLPIDIEIETHHCELVKFTVNNEYEGIISKTAPYSITVTLPSDLNNDTNIQFSAVHTGAIIEPEPGTLRLSELLKGVSVTAADGTVNTYSVEVELGEIHTGAQSDPFPLTAPGSWKDGNLQTNSSEIWYQLNVPGGSRYYLWWNDYYEGNNTKDADILVSAFYSDNLNYSIIDEVSSAFNTASYVDGKAGVTILIRVRIASSRTGTYSIAYTTENVRPKVLWPAGLADSPINITASPAVWIDGNLQTSGSEIWYQLDVPAGSKYYLWWNDCYEGNNTKEADIVVNAYYSDDYVRIINEESSAFNSSFYIDGKAGVTILIRVNIASNRTGTYSIAYTTTNNKPIVQWPAGLLPSAINITNSLGPGVWLDGNLSTSESVIWYQLDVPAGSRYYLWWNDCYEGNNTKEADIVVNAYYSDEYVRIINEESSGFNSSFYIDGKAGATVYIRVSIASNRTGTFSIAYTTENNRPIVNWPMGLPSPEINISVSPGPGEWLDGNLATSSSVVWYELNVQSEERYYLWWNDCYEGNNTKDADVLVSAYYSDDYVRIINEESSGFNSPSYIDGIIGVTIYIRVSVASGRAGDYSIAYTTENKRPIVDWPPSYLPPTIISLNLDGWYDGTLTTAAQEDWLVFNTTPGTRYYIWWNDLYEGNGNKDADILVSVYHANDYVRIINDADSGYNTAAYIDCEDGIDVYIRVTVASGRIGDYCIVYSSVNTRPDY